MKIDEQAQSLAASQAEVRELLELIGQRCDGSGYQHTYREDERGIEHQVDEPCGGCLACRAPGSTDALRAFGVRVATDVLRGENGVDAFPQYDEAMARAVVDNILGRAGSRGTT